jgi:hypothetical protein
MFFIIKKTFEIFCIGNKSFVIIYVMSITID